MAGAYQSFKTFIRGQEPEPEPQTLQQKLAAEISEATNLTPQQRIVGFFVCFLCAVVLLFLSMSQLFNPVSFAVLYTFGSLFGIGCTFFLMGPAAQFKAMFSKHRWIATTVYLLALVATLIVAIVTRWTLLTLILIFVQVGALIWYSFTYVPGGQGFLGRAVGVSSFVGGQV